MYSLSNSVHILSNVCYPVPRIKTLLFNIEVASFIHTDNSYHIISYRIVPDKIIAHCITSNLQSELGSIQQIQFVDHSLQSYKRQYTLQCTHTVMACRIA